MIISKTSDIWYPKGILLILRRINFLCKGKSYFFISINPREQKTVVFNLLFCSTLSHKKLNFPYNSWKCSYLYLWTNFLTQILNWYILISIGHFYAVPQTSWILSITEFIIITVVLNESSHMGLLEIYWGTFSCHRWF